MSPAPLPEAIRAAAVARFALGHSTAVIARELNVNPSTVGVWRYNAGLSKSHEEWRKHGSASRYDKGCRCDPCCSARKDENARKYQRRLAKRAAEIEPTIHGTSMGRVDFGCKCDACMKAQNRYYRSFARKRQKESIAGARRCGYIWTGPELELLERRDLTHADIAAMLGRTYVAVKSMRHRLNRGDPKLTWLAGVSHDTPTS